MIGIHTLIHFDCLPTLHQYKRCARSVTTTVQHKIQEKSWLSMKQYTNAQQKTIPNDADNNNSNSGRHKATTTTKKTKGYRALILSVLNLSIEKIPCATATIEMRSKPCIRKFVNYNLALMTNTHTQHASAQRMQFLERTHHNSMIQIQFENSYQLVKRLDVISTFQMRLECLEIC